MPKPTVYLDTSIISAFWYKGADSVMSMRRARTREWWEWERPYFDIWASAVVAAELSAGSFAGQSECIKMVRRCRYLHAPSRAEELRAQLVEGHVVPQKKGGDAAHLAISCFHGIDYLLTWNYAHMANQDVQARLNEMCERFGLRSPLMVSPAMIPQVRLGQTVRRKH